ncbi:MAG: protein kinase [Candidatus Solibacter sp.]
MILTEELVLNDTTTLAQVLAPARLPVAEALRYAMQLAECLRQLHEKGGWHGVLSPSNIAVEATGLQLLPPPEGSTRMVTPYTAPEVVLGQPADERSDVFSFGAIIFEMLTGRRAFEGDSRAALAAQITKAPTPASGSPAVDRMVGPCLAKAAEGRPPRMQKIMMDLKLLSGAARRSGQSAPPSLRREPAAEPGMGRAEIQQMEARMAARLQLHERTMAEMHRSASEAVSTVKLQLAGMGSEVASSRNLPSISFGNSMDEGATTAIQARIDRGFEALNARMSQLERSVEEMRRKFTQFEHNIAADLVDIEHGLKTQGAAIESGRTAMSQTDDLVERVVEALESPQTAVLDSDVPAPESASFAIN